MSAEDFKVIETQEEFDKAIQKRLAQKDREAAEKYKDFLSPEEVAEIKTEYENRIKEATEQVKTVKESYASKDAEFKELTERAEKAEKSLLKNRIAHENGLPLELSARLIGDTEEELKADAESLAAFMKPQSAPPLMSFEPVTTDSKTAAWAQMVAGLNPQS